MTLQELRTHIEYFTGTEDAIGLTLYVISTDEQGNETIRLADIEAAANAELKTQYLSYLKEKFLDNEELSFMNISEGDNRRNTAFFYDIAEKPTELNVIDTVLQNDLQPQFSFRRDDFENIKAFIITIGNDTQKVALYKHHHHLSLLKSDTVFGLQISDHRFVRVREDIIKLSKAVDFLQIGNDLVVISLKVLESEFRFDNIIRGIASDNIQTISAINLLESIDPLTEMALDLRFAKKIMRIKHDSPVLQLPVTHIIHFVQNHPPIMRKFRTNEDGSRLVLDTMVSKKLFLQLMNDDLLTSTLTQRYYESLAKDAMAIEN